MARNQILVPIGDPEQGFDQRFSFVCGAGYLLLKSDTLLLYGHYWVPINFWFHKWPFQENAYHSINFASRAFIEKQMAAKRSFKNKFTLIKKLFLKI